MARTQGTAFRQRVRVVVDDVTLMDDSDQNCLVDNFVGFDHSGDQALEFESNWWGATDGPSGVGPGSGDSVEENSTGTVDYSPWLPNEGTPPCAVPEPGRSALVMTALVTLACLQRIRAQPSSLLCSAGR